MKTFLCSDAAGRCGPLDEPNLRHLATFEVSYGTVSFVHCNDLVVTVLDIRVLIACFVQLFLLAPGCQQINCKTTLPDLNCLFNIFPFACSSSSVLSSKH